MTKYINKIICIAVAVMFASPASAAITELGRGFESGMFNFMYFGSTNLGGGMGGGTEGGAYKCNAAYGEYYSKPAGMSCEHEKVNGTWCYTGCACSANLFPFSAKTCTEPNFVAPTAASDRCTDSTGTYYASCACGAGLTLGLDLSSYNTAKAHMDLPTAVIVENRNKPMASVLCYNLRNATCKSSNAKEVSLEDIKDVTINQDGHVRLISKAEPITYNAASFAQEKDLIMNGTYKLCSFSVAQYSQDVQVTESNMTKDCAEYESKQLKYDPAGGYYYYYTGNCKDSGLCTTSSHDCALYTTQTFKSYTADGKQGNGSCKKITGCKTGWDDADGYFCSSYESGSVVVPTGIAHNTLHSEDADHDDCIKVTGCSINYAPLAFREGTYGNEVDDVTRGYNANNIVSFVSHQDPNDNTFGMVVCEKTVPCTVGTYYNEQTKACTTSKEGGRKYFVTGTTSGGKCTVMGIPNTYGKGNIAYTVDWTNGGSSSPSTTASAALESAQERCNQLAGRYEFKYGIASYADYIHWMKTENSNLWYDENESSPAPTIITDDGLGIDAYQGYVAYLRPDTAPGDVGGENFQYYCKMTVDCGSTANSSVPTDIVAPGKWYDSNEKVVKTDGSGDFFIVNSRIGDVSFDAVSIDGYSKYTTSKAGVTDARNEAKGICSANGGTLVSSDELSLIMTDSAGNLTEGGDDGSTVTMDGCYSHTDKCGATARYNVVCKYTMTTGQGKPFAGSANIYCKVGQFYNPSNNSCGTTETDWIVASNGTKGLRLAYVAGGFVTPSQYTANVSSAQTYGFDACENNEFDGLLTTSEMESLGLNVIDRFTIKLDKAGMTMGNSDSRLLVSDGQKCIDGTILGADSYYCPSGYYSVMCSTTLTEGETISSSIKNPLSCSQNMYLNPSTKYCSAMNNLSNNMYLVISKSGSTCTVAPAHMTSEEVYMARKNVGGRWEHITDLAEAREYARNACIDMEGTDLVTTDVVKKMGSTPFESLDNFQGYVVTDGGCYNFNDGTTTCLSSGPFAYVCELKYQCY